MNTISQSHFLLHQSFEIPNPFLCVVWKFSRQDEKTHIVLQTKYFKENLGAGQAIKPDLVPAAKQSISVKALARNLYRLGYRFSSTRLIPLP
jgi:hypothetical protein